MTPLRSVQFDLPLENNRTRPWESRILIYTCSWTIILTFNISHENKPATGTLIPRRLENTDDSQEMQRMPGWSCPACTDPANSTATSLHRLCLGPPNYCRFPTSKQQCKHALALILQKVFKILVLSLWQSHTTFREREWGRERENEREWVSKRES